MTGREALDEARQELQLQGLHRVRIGDDEAAPNRGFLRFVLRLLERQLGEDVIESIDQLFRIDGSPHVHLGIGQLVQALVNGAAVVGQRHLVVSDDRQVGRFLAEHLQQHVKACLVTRALVEVGHCRNPFSSKRIFSGISGLGFSYRCRPANASFRLNT